MRCASRMRASRPARATSRWSAAPTMRERRDMLLLYGSAGCLAKAHVRAGLGARSARRRDGARLARRVPGAGSRASTPRRAAQSRWRASAAVAVRPHRGAAGRSDAHALDADVAAASRRNSTAAASPSSRARPGAEPATAEERAWLETSRTCRCAPPATYARAWLGAAIRHEYRACHARAWARQAVSAAATRRASSGRWTVRSTQVVVTGVGHWRGEGMALVEAVQ